jgi:hypothetical protein
MMGGSMISTFKGIAERDFVLAISDYSCSTLLGDSVIPVFGYHMFFAEYAL